MKRTNPSKWSPLVEVVEEIHAPKRKGPRTPSSLGELLWSTADLYEAMDAYADERLIEKYLTHVPPLHPRRTLDQSYYWTLKDTQSRDRDQVVYRRTAPSLKLLLSHQYCKQEHPKGPGCAQCRENVSKVPRIVMVDQLWMWILDESESQLLFESLRLF